MMAGNVVVLDDARWDRVHKATAGAMDACFQCGTCTASCPFLGQPGGAFSARALMRRAQLGLGGNGGNGDLWRCVACRQCEARCPRQVNVVEAIMGLRALAFEDGQVPPEAHKLLWSSLEEGNPSGSPRSERGRWAEGLGLKDAAQGAKVLLYVGCAASYDARLQQVARSLARILRAAGVDAGILGGKEPCCGDAVRSMGERAWLGKLVDGNVKAFQATKAETIVALSPHCYDAFRNLYPKHGLEAEVLHATEYLERLLDAGKLPTPARREGQVAYHDPCFLGRANGVFEPPRKLLEHVPGLKLVEFQDRKLNALCCGGGGGGMWRDDPARLGDQRYAQARGLGAATLATACPYCIQNFEGARRGAGPQVADVVELLGPGGGA